MKPNLLIVDDEEPFREDLARLLRRRGFECRTTGDIEAAIETVRALGPCLVLCDVVMPGGGALALLREIGGTPEAGVFVMTAFGSLETAMEAFRAGAVDYLLKPLNVDEVDRKVRQFLDHQEALSKLSALRRELVRATEVTRLVGKSRAMARVHELIKRVAPTRTTVLITGETGTGKEVAARLLHQASPCREERFVAVNCAALPHSLLEGELFGYLRGAFTGAVRDKIGLVEAAKDGTLFLDEISEMNIETQAKLLRVVEQKEVLPLGATRPRTVDTRIVASTNRNLALCVKAGTFREDLFFRLSVMELHLPPLRERREDIPLLVEHFLRKFSADLKRDIRGIDRAAMQMFVAYPWPGNVREIQNVIERAAILTEDGMIAVEHLPERLSGNGPRRVMADDLRAALRIYEQEHIRHVLDAASGNKEEAARCLGIDPATLYRKLSTVD